MSVLAPMRPTTAPLASRTGSMTHASTRGPSHDGRSSPRNGSPVSSTCCLTAVSWSARGRGNRSSCLLPTRSIRAGRCSPSDSAARDPARTRRCAAASAMRKRASLAFSSSYQPRMLEDDRGAPRQLLRDHQVVAIAAPRLGGGEEGHDRDGGVVRAQRHGDHRVHADRAAPDRGGLRYEIGAQDVVGDHGEEERAAGEQLGQAARDGHGLRVAAPRRGRPCPDRAARRRCAALRRRSRRRTTNRRARGSTARRSSAAARRRAVPTSALTLARSSSRRVSW